MSLFGNNLRSEDPLDVSGQYYSAIYILTARGWNFSRSRSDLLQRLPFSHLGEWYVMS